MPSRLTVAALTTSLVLAAGACGLATHHDAFAGEARERAPDQVSASGSSPGDVLPRDADPGVRGSYQTTTGEYALPDVEIPGLRHPVEMKGLVVAPRAAEGPRPLVVLLHGMHDACSADAERGGDDAVWPCAGGAQPVPSYRGYVQTQQLLASQGYVTVSISANGINGQDDMVDSIEPRSALVRRHLVAWSSWAGADRAAAPAIVREAPVADLSKVMLVGHSRGGDGVNRAVLDSLLPPAPEVDGYVGPVTWTIRGQVLLAPMLTGQNPVPDVPSLVVLPGCDGDVRDLHGQRSVDATRGVSNGKALHSAVYVVGANHNFFNREWTPGLSVGPSVDDATSLGMDRWCRPAAGHRLSAAQQRTVGATYVAAAARLFLSDDQRVLPLLDGSGARAASVRPARTLSHAVGGGRTAFVVPGTGVTVTGGRLCDEVTTDRERACLWTDRFESRSPHFAGMWGFRELAARQAVDLQPSRGEKVTVRPEESVDLRGSTHLALRIAVAPGTRDNRFEVAAVSRAGRRTVLGRVRLDGLPGGDSTASYWAQEVRVPLGRAGRGGRVAALELTPVTDVQEAFLIDAWGWSAGTPAPQVGPLLRVDLADLVVRAADARGAVGIPVHVEGQGAGAVRLTAVAADGKHRSWVVRVGEETTSIRMPGTIAASLAKGDANVIATGVRRVVVGDYDATVSPSKAGG